MSDENNGYKSSYMDDHAWIDDPADEPTVIMTLSQFQALNELAATQKPYHYIGKDGKTVLASDLEDERDALRAEGLELRAANARLREVSIKAASSLAAAISLLERGGKRAAPSYKMFAQMLADYHAALEDARAALKETTK